MIGPMRRDERVIVVGGGIAGIAAALRLSEHEVPVILLETRPRLGGRATSFTDPRNGEIIDNCQHVAMGCCTNYLDLCRRLGVDHHIVWTRAIHWVEAGGRVSTMQPGGLPAPGHFAAGLIGASFLSAQEKVSLAAALMALLMQRRADVRTITFAQWLQRHDQGARLIERFWAPVVVSACNLGVDRVCAATAAHVFQDGFMAHRDAPRIGVAGVPLVRLYDHAIDAISRAGGMVRLGTGVERVTADAVVTTAGERIAAGRVILAVPPERAARIIDPALARIDRRFDAMRMATHSPIVGVHLVFDRPITALPHAVLVGRETQWVFRKDDEGRRLHAVISAADALIPQSEEQIIARVTGDVRACFPASSTASVVTGRAVKEKLATFAPTPQIESIRPTTTGDSGVILAGDFVQTGWPATMEGATRSGYMAAAAAMGLADESMLTSGLRPAPLARLLLGDD